METLDCISGCCYLRWVQKRKATVKLAQEEQYKISLECKRNPKKFWHYITVIGQELIRR